MKFKIGDKVSFLNEKGSGIVSSIINKTTVGVTIEDGFVIPYPIAELVGTTPQPLERPNYIKASTMDAEIIKNFEKQVENFSLSNEQNTEGLFAALAPVKPEQISYSDFNLWLINNTGYELFCSYSVFKNSGFLTLETAVIKEKQSELITTISRKELHDYATFKIDAILYSSKPHLAYAPITELIKLKPIKLYKENVFVANSFLPIEAMIINIHTLGSTNIATDLHKADLAKMLVQKQSHKGLSKKSKPHIANDPAYEMEVDLHIEELIDDFKGMSNAEIIQIQLRHFQNQLDEAINQHYRKLIVIHGVGNGRLKQEVRAILATYTKLEFYDASYSKYGFGATEINFK